VVFDNYIYSRIKVATKKKPPDPIRRLSAYLHHAVFNGMIEIIGPGDRSLLYLGGWKVMGASA